MIFNLYHITFLLFIFNVFYYDESA
jgi:hypothetical protein